MCPEHLLPAASHQHSVSACVGKWNQEPRRFYARSSLLIISERISLSLKAPKLREGKAFVQHHSGWNLGFHFPSQASIGSSGFTPEILPCFLTPTSLWILTKGVNSATWAGRSGCPWDGFSFLPQGREISGAQGGAEGEITAFSPHES